MQITKLNLQDKLPLTCSRMGTCCHGNVVMLNPWELFRLAKAKAISSRKFRDQFCEPGGIQLKFNGNIGYNGKKACSQYIENFGCSVHTGRPLACRLFPLGRQIQSEEIHYMFQGSEFPCLTGCPVVEELPKLTVKDYIQEQATEQYENAQDAYLEVMQNIADIAFELLLNTGLSESGDKKTLPLWRKMGYETSEILSKRLGSKWTDLLVIPDILYDGEDSTLFVENHFEMLQLSIQEKVGALKTNADIHKASVSIMGLALHLARAIGADPAALADHWADTAISFGAKG